jgi:predicted TIM-barrel fold metal-dependent hydrolase
VKNTFPKRFIIFANVDFNGVGNDNWTENAVKQLEEDVKNGANGLKIFKNLGFSVTDKSGKRVTVDDPRLDPIWKKCGELKIPVLIHTADPKSSGMMWIRKMKGGWNWPHIQTGREDLVMQVLKN